MHPVAMQIATRRPPTKLRLPCSYRTCQIVANQQSEIRAYQKKEASRAGLRRGTVRTGRRPKFNDIAHRDSSGQHFIQRIVMMMMK